MVKNINRNNLTNKTKKATPLQSSKINGGYLLTERSMSIFFRISFRHLCSFPYTHKEHQKSNELIQNGSTF